MSGPIERVLARATQNGSQLVNPMNNNETSDPRDQSTITPGIDLHARTAKDTNQSTRKRHHVNTLKERYNVTKWMIEKAFETTEKFIVSRAVAHFDGILSGSSKTKLQKVSRWWQVRHQTILLKQDKRRLKTLSASVSNGSNRLNFKANKGRGRRRAPWVTALYEDLFKDFERLRSAGLKFSPGVLRTHAIKLIEEASLDNVYNRLVVFKGKRLSEIISYRWVQRFMKAKQIVTRAQTGKLQLSPEKEAFVEKEVAFHLGVLKRGFASGVFKEDRMENADETHFVFNMDNGRTLGFIGDRQVKYADLVSGGDPITLMVRLKGGPHASIQPPMLIFKNESCNYPIRNVPDNIPWVCYRTGPKGWMDKRVFEKWLKEPRAFGNSHQNVPRTLFVDNCSSHIETETALSQLRKLNTTLKKFPANATHLLQPADSFVIQKIKDAWRSRWDKYKYECVRDGRWSGSGRLPNPGKCFYLKLAVRDVNSQRDKNRITYARKAMIRTGMSLNLNGLWEESQLTDELQAIIAKYRSHFDGEPVRAADVETESESE